jgi:hypothetical protein
MHLLLAIGLTALLMATSFTFLKVVDPHFFEGIAEKSNGAVFAVLGAIVRRDKLVGSGDYQGRFDWVTLILRTFPLVY